MKAQFLPYSDEKISKKTPYVTYGLIIANILIFILSFIDFEGIVTTYGFIPADPSLISVFTSMFLHAGIFHIALNMWYLYIFGDNIEHAFGRTKFLLFYMASGIFALTFHYMTSPSSVFPAVGASGAISGVLGAYLVMLPRMKIKAIGFFTLWKLPTYIIIGSWFALQIILAVSGIFTEWGDVAFWAHIGGFVFGAMMGFLYNKYTWTSLFRRYRKH